MYVYILSRGYFLIRIHNVKYTKSKNKINIRHSTLNERLVILEDLQNLECRCAEQSKFYTRDHFFYSIVTRELLRNRGCNFSTLIYLRGFALCLIANRIFARQANSVGKYERDANSMPYAQKGLRVFPLSETAIADITVTGILVGSQS